MHGHCISCYTLQKEFYEYPSIRIYENRTKTSVSGVYPSPAVQIQAILYLYHVFYVNVIDCYCVYPQHERDNKEFHTALAYLSSESLLHDVAVTEV